MVTTRPEPESAQWVAWWAAERVVADGEDGCALWVRWLNGGMAWIRTADPHVRPVGRWRYACWVDHASAARAIGRERDPYETQFRALMRLVEPIQAAMDDERSAA